MVRTLGAGLSRLRRLPETKSNTCTSRRQFVHRLYDSTTGKYLRVDPEVSEPWDDAPEPVYEYASAGPLRWDDPTGLFTTPGGAQKCPTLNSAAGMAAGWFGSAGPGGSNCSGCNACRKSFCGCPSAQGWFDPWGGGGPPIYITDKKIRTGMLRVGAHTNCSTVSGQGQSSDHPPNSIAIYKKECKNVRKLAKILVHEMTHWCFCQQGANHGLTWKQAKVRNQTCDGAWTDRAAYTACACSGDKKK